MAALKPESVLADHHYVTLILRLSIDQEGELRQSELLDTTGSLSRWFANRASMHQMLDDCLNQLSQSYSKKHQSESPEP